MERGIEPAMSTMRGMALLHRAEITPSKTELITAWAVRQAWFQGERGVEVTKVGAYRFDDPDGEVGVETLLVRAGEGPVLQVPLTYRAAPLEGAQESLVGTTVHTVLGPRWVYDACEDPVYAAVLARVEVEGGTQAEEQFEVDGKLWTRPNELRVSAPGGTTAAAVGGAPAAVQSPAGDVELLVVRDVDAGGGLTGPGTLTGSWPGRQDVLLAAARRR